MGRKDTSDEHVVYSAKTAARSRRHTLIFHRSGESLSVLLAKTDGQHIVGRSAMKGLSNSDSSDSFYRDKD